MAFTISAFSYDEWLPRPGRLLRLRRQISGSATSARHVLAASANGFFVPLMSSSRTVANGLIYFGFWGTTTAPGASSYTNAEIFDSS